MDSRQWMWREWGCNAHVYIFVNIMKYIMSLIIISALEFVTILRNKRSKYHPSFSPSFLFLGKENSKPLEHARVHVQLYKTQEYMQTFEQNPKLIQVITRSNRISFIDGEIWLALKWLILRNKHNLYRSCHCFDHENLNGKTR